jgi:mono/diheme cytochrome c family protein
MSEKLQNTSCFKYNWVFMVGLVLLAACAGEPTVDPLDIGDPVRGRQLFEGGEPLNNGCIECHSLDGSDELAPTMLGLSDRAGERVPDLSAVDYLRQSIVDPRAYVVEGFLNNMPTSLQYILIEEDIDALVAFMLMQ